LAAVSPHVISIISIVENKMKKNSNSGSYHWEFINKRFVKGLSLMEVSYSPNLELPYHSHRLAGFCLVLQGGYTELYGKTALECEPSSIKFHPADEPHSDLYGNKGVHSFIIEPELSWLDQMGANHLIENNPLVFRNNSMAWLMMRIRKEFHSMDAESLLVIEGLALELIAEASRSRRRVSADKEPRWLRRAKEFIDEQYCEPLTLSAIAEAVGVHPVYLAN
jgi:AraC family transcriptional regulator